MIHVGFIPVVLLYFFLHLLSSEDKDPAWVLNIISLYSSQDVFFSFTTPSFFIALDLISLEPTLQNDLIAIASWLCPWYLRLRVTFS